MAFRLFLVTSIFICVTSYPHYQLRIPNGNLVPSPCKPDKIWQGVGHFIDEGTGMLNPFGLDFAAAGHNWTVELCQKDSDGDGRTNGEELGDPDCRWEVNTAPNITTNITHPGICDPWDSPECQQKPVSGGKYQNQQQWLKAMCKTDGLNCSALTEPDIQNVTVRMPLTRVPAKVTTYECLILDIQQLGVDPNETYHMVAVTPVIDNKNVLHHMVLSGCTDDTEIRQPFECGMLASDKCQRFLHVWTVGLDGECYHNESGIRIGRGGARFLAIQLHWNNPEKRADFIDSSGLTLYYTPNLRHYDAGILTIGSSQFYLPPKTQELSVHSTCGSDCTWGSMLGPINVTSAWNHMHYAGRKMRIEVTRNNNHVTYLTDDASYSYDSPQVYTYQDPFIMYPGDELLTTCGFTTKDRNRTTFYGEGTQDEMCFGFITYYPAENFTKAFCLDKLEISTCKKETWGECKNLDTFIKNFSTSSFYEEVTNNCQVFTPCVTECLETIIKYTKSEPCLSGKIWEYVQDRLKSSDYFGTFQARVASCKEKAVVAPPPSRTNDGSNDNIVKSRGSVSLPDGFAAPILLALSMTLTWMCS